MTRKRYDNHSTEFGLWLREQDIIDSKKGFTATNLDYIWRNYRTGFWRLIEEKRYGSKPTFAQRQCFSVLHKCAKTDPFYRGFYLVKFEQTSPEDGVIWINNEPATKDELIALLTFAKD